jgi:hypothetical protein
LLSLREGCDNPGPDSAALLTLLPASASRIIECLDPDEYGKSVEYLSAIEDPAYRIPNRW